MGYWLGIVFSCLDVLCVAVFCDAFLERKTRGLRFVVGALLCGVLSYIATIFVSHISEESPITLLKFAALITVYFVFASLFYLGKFWMRLLVVLLAYAIFTLLEFCVLYSLLALLHIHYDEYVSNMVLYFTGVTITYSLKFLLFSAIKRIHRPVVASSGNIKWAPLTIGFPLISLVGITIYYYLLPQRNWNRICTALVCPVPKSCCAATTPFTRWIIMTVRSNSALNGPMWPAILAFTHEFLSLAQDSWHFSLVCGRIRAKDDKEMPMEQIAKKLTQYFLAHGLIKEDDAEVCQYALYRHISRAVGLIALTLLGGLITDFGLAFCFTVSFLFLRERTGGYHAKTEWQCALYSAAMIFATMFALPIFAEEPNNYWAIMIASSALIWVSSPADNKQMHLSRAESKAMAKRARLRLLLLDAVSLALLGVHGHLFASSIALAELSVAVSLMMATAGFGIQ